MGGDCLNVGCVPSKSLIAAGDRAQAIRAAGRFGIAGASEPAVDFARVREHVRAVIAAIAPNDSVERFTALGVRVHRRRGALHGSRTPSWPGARPSRRAASCSRRGRGRRCRRSRGSTRSRYLTNETVFDLAERPGHLLVIGGGPIGVEIAQAHRRLGAAVTIVEAAPRLLPREDPEMAQVVERALAEDGVAVHAGVDDRAGRAAARRRVAVVVRNGGGAARRRGSHLLVATGRRPVDRGARPRGGRASRSTRTASSSIAGFGRRTGASTRSATAPAERPRAPASPTSRTITPGSSIRSALFRLPVRVDGAPIPRVTFTDPELAAVGLSEEEASGAARARARPALARRRERPRPGASARPAGWSRPS